MATWKITPAQFEEVEYTSFADAAKFFAVDASGSTAGSCLRSERDFVSEIYKTSTHKSTVIATRWGSSCEQPAPFNAWKPWNSNLGGTNPSSILLNRACLNAVGKSDVWFLLTDGEVYEEQVRRLAELGRTTGIFQCPTVFLITSYLGDSPSKADISVGITSYANCQDALCLFKDYRSGRIYVMAAKGCFEQLNQAKDDDMIFWEALTSFGGEAELLKAMHDMEIRLPSAATRSKRSAGLNLGEEWNATQGTIKLVDLEKLLQASEISDTDLRHLFAAEAFNALALAYKSWGMMAEFRRFVLTQKVQETFIKLEDIYGAGDLLNQLHEPNLTGPEKATLQFKLRDAHSRNGEHYLKKLEDDATGAAARDRNRLVDAALRQLADINASGFSAEILKRRSNRARRAEEVGNDTAVHIKALNFKAPAFKAECPICCNEDAIMSVALKKLDEDAEAANTADFALDFPLAAGRFPANMNVLSSQMICFNCALFGRPGYTMFGEPIAAIIPTLEYSGENKTYINQELYVALNGGLKTGVPVLGQLFATILDRTMQEKVWAGAGDDEHVDSETQQRKNMILWLTENILSNLHCRETFSELGDWCKYSQALAWVAKDFHDRGLSSWAINYPVAGFMQLLRFGQMLNSFSDQDIRVMKAYKLVHSFASTYLAKLLKEKDRGWTKNVLPMVYTEFNSDHIPRDLGGDATIMTSTAKFWELLNKFLAMEPELLANWSETDKASIMPRIQLLAFSLVYYQHNHTSAKTYFSQREYSDPLAAVALDLNGNIPRPLYYDTLLQPFVDPTAFHNRRLAESHNAATPFKTPFGPSILGCNSGDCTVSFVPESIKHLNLQDVKWTPRLLDEVRQKRARHLIQAYGAAPGFVSNQTGLPEPTLVPMRPSSRHTPMHISIARAWTKMSVEQRREVADALLQGRLEGASEVERFVWAVREEVCRSGRGDIYSSQLDSDVRAVLRSFVQALSEAVALQGGNGKDVASYQHNFEENTLELKIMHELRVNRLRSGGE